MQYIRNKLTYANVVASFALFLALAGGTAFAASQFGKETIAGRAIKKESIGPGKLTKAAKAGIVGPAGAKGATGPQGPAGPAGAPGAAGATKVDVQYGAEADGSFAHCGPGQVATGGGGEGVATELFVTEPLTGNEVTPVGGTPNGWFAKAEGGEPAIAYVVCASP